MLAIARAMAKQCEDVPTLLGCANVTAAGRCDGCTCGGGGSFTRSGMSNLQKVTGSGAHSGQGLITIKGPLAPFAVKLHKYSPSMPIIEWRDWVTPKGSQYGTKWVCATCSLISIIVNP